MNARRKQSVPPPRRSRLRTGLVALLMLALLVAFLPLIAARTSLRHWLVNQSIADPRFEAHVGAASFGWISPLSLTDLAVDHTGDATQVNVGRVKAQRSWLQLWLSLPDVGRIEIERPRLNLVVDPQAAQPQTASFQGDVTLNAVVTDAEILVQTPHQTEPVIHLSGLDLAASIVERGQGRELIIQPAVVFDRQPQSPQLCHQGLQLVAPALADSTSVAGEVTFQLNKFRVPLGGTDAHKGAERMEIAGLLTLHHVSAGLKNPAVSQVVQLVATLLHVEIPRTIRVVEDTEVAFEVREGRVYHEGLAFVLSELTPDFVVRTSGSVGIDESLDLTVEVVIPPILLRDGPVGRQLSRHPFAVHVAGSLDQPKIELPLNQPWLWVLVRDVLSHQSTQGDHPLANALIDALEDLIEQPPNPESPTPILDRLRQARRADGDEAGGRPTPLLDLLRQRLEAPGTSQETSNK